MPPLSLVEEEVSLCRRVDEGFTYCDKPPHHDRALEAVAFDTSLWAVAHTRVVVPSVHTDSWLEDWALQERGGDPADALDLLCLLESAGHGVAVVLREAMASLLDRAAFPILARPARLLRLCGLYQTNRRHEGAPPGERAAQVVKEVFAALERHKARVLAHSPLPEVLTGLVLQYEGVEARALAQVRVIEPLHGGGWCSHHGC